MKYRGDALTRKSLQENGGVGSVYSVFNINIASLSSPDKRSRGPTVTATRGAWMLALRTPGTSAARRAGASRPGHLGGRPSHPHAAGALTGTCILRLTLHEMVTLRSSQQAASWKLANLFIFLFRAGSALNRRIFLFPSRVPVSCERVTPVSVFLAEILGGC